MKRSECWHWIVTLVLLGMVLVSWLTTRTMRERMWDDELEVLELAGQARTMAAQIPPEPASIWDSHMAPECVGGNALIQRMVYYDDICPIPPQKQLLRCDTSIPAGVITLCPDYQHAALAGIALRSE